MTSMTLSEIRAAHEADLVSRAPCGMICHAQTILKREFALLAHIDRLEAEIAALIHDNANAVTAASSYATELVKAEATAMELEGAGKYHCNICGGQVDISNATEPTVGFGKTGATK